MRQLYYTIRILLRGRGNNIIKLVSLTLGLLIGVLLFSQIAYELNYENFYKEPDNVVLLRNRYIKNKDRKSTRLNSSHRSLSRMPSSA